MGTVYRGLDQHNHEPIAIKALSASQDGREQIDSFLQEGRMLRELDHPNILRHLDTLQEDQLHYLILDFAEGGDLSERLDADSGLDIAELLLIALDLADALTRAHQLGIIHRDIKPANVLLTEAGTPLLADFGIARFRLQDYLDEGELYGTVPYISPETIRGQPADELTDIWSFGVLLFECLTGQLPFDASTTISLMHAIQNQDLPDIQTIRPEIGDSLADLVYRMLSRQRETRIPSVRLIGAELEALIKGQDYDLNAARARANYTHSTENGQSQLFQAPTPVSRPQHHNLPTQPTPFVGRVAALAEISNWLTTEDMRLITVLGPGGMGKTRFALRAAESLLDHFPDGTYFAELASIEDAAQVPATIAEAVGLEISSGGDPMERLREFLGPKSLLLVIDNFEHLLESAPRVSELLEAAPNLTVMTTSRERLNLAGEQHFRLRGMQHASEGAGSLEDEAVSLFLQGTQRVRPGFEIQNGDLVAIQAICRQVEGMPLAIEMAAAWVKMLSPAEIRAEIAASTDILESERRDTPERHRSIRAVIEHSWEMLNSAEQGIFSELSVFRGGFNREAAQAVTGAGLRQLMSLMDKSLIRRDRGGRYQIHELLRQFGNEQLHTDRDHWQATRDAHSRHFLVYLDSIQETLNFQPVHEAFLEMDNIRRAWRWGVESGFYDELIAVDMAMGWLFEYQGLAHDHRPLLLWTLEALKERPRERKRTILEALITARTGWTRPSEAGVPAMNRALELLEPLREERHIASVKSNFAISFGDETSQFERSNAYLQEIIPYFRKHGPEWRVSFCLDVWGQNNKSQGHTETGRTYVLEALAIDRAIQNPRGIAWSLATLAMSYFHEGDFEQSIELYAESLQRFRDMGYQRLVRVITRMFGEVYLAQRDYGQAQPLLEEALQLALKAGDHTWATFSARSLGNCSLGMGDMEATLRYFRQASDFTPKDYPFLERHSRFQLQFITAQQEGLLHQIQPVLDLLNWLDEDRIAGFGEIPLISIVAEWLQALSFEAAAAQLMAFVGSTNLLSTKYRAINFLQDLEKTLSPAEFQTAEIAGQAMNSQEAVTFALQVFENLEPNP